MAAYSTKVALKAKTKTKVINVKDMLYMDDAGFVAHSEKHQQTVTDTLSGACKAFGLTISTQNTKQPQIEIDGKVLEKIEKFTYLDSTIANKISLEAEVEV